MKEFNSHKDILADMPEKYHHGQYKAWERFNNRTVEERIAICEDEFELLSALNNAYFRTIALTLIDLYTEKIHKDHC